MKQPIVVSCLAVLLLAGCNGSSDKPGASTNTTSSGSSPLDAPGDYLKGLAKAQQSAVKTVDLSAVTKAIQMFGVDQGRNPKDLNELVEKKYMPKLPDAPYGMKIVYDADAGTVKMEKQ